MDLFELQHQVLRPRVAARDVVRLRAPGSVLLTLGVIESHDVSRTWEELSTRSSLHW